MTKISNAEIQEWSGVTKFCAVLSRGGTYAIPDDHAAANYIKAGQKTLVHYEEEDQFAYILSYAEVERAFEALRMVQEALANWRDGEDVALKHPKHGDLCLEEVKYCVVDPALEWGTV